MPPTMVSGLVQVGIGREGERLILFKLKSWSVMQNMIPYVGQLILAQIPV